MTSSNWPTRAKAKRDHLESLIPPEWRLGNVPSKEECPNVLIWSRMFLTPAESTITETDALVVLANIHAQIWSTEEVVRAFCHRAAIAHQLTNCLTEILFEEAISAAQQLDQQYQAQGILQGPLHGLPMSFMDRYRVAGSETAAGYISWIGHRETSETESLLVRHMRRLGAVPFCKTNVPQSMMLAATDNNILGSTLNPFVRSLSAGGAAGGEGALQAMKGSPFGWATEIAGSARIPAAYNGLFALRVCAGRLPTLGIASSHGALPICGITPAMISSSLPMLQHMSRLTLGSKAYQEDSQWLNVPWRDDKCQELDRRRPRFAILHHDQHVRPQPPVQRALNFVREALSAHGYDVVEWDPPHHKPAVENLFRIIGADGGAEIRSQIKQSGEPAVKGLQSWYSDPVPIVKVPVEQFWSWCQQRTEYNIAYQRYWKDSGMDIPSRQQVDGVIMPVTANAASHEHELSYFGYSAIVNHLDYAAVSFPVTFVDRTVDFRQFDTDSISAEDAKVRSGYDPNVFHGAPVGLQVMCRRIEEETSLRLAERAPMVPIVVLDTSKLDFDECNGWELAKNWLRSDRSATWCNDPSASMVRSTCPLTEIHTSLSIQIQHLRAVEKGYGIPLFSDMTVPSSHRPLSQRLAGCYGWLDDLV